MGFPVLLNTANGPVQIEVVKETDGNEAIILRDAQGNTYQPGNELGEVESLDGSDLTVNVMTAEDDSFTAPAEETEVEDATVAEEDAEDAEEEAEELADAEDASVTPGDQAEAEAVLADGDPDTDEFTSEGAPSLDDDDA